MPTRSARSLGRSQPVFNLLGAAAGGSRRHGGLANDVGLLAASLLRGARTVFLSKGFATAVFLYLMRYDNVVRLYKQALLVGTGAAALWLNFHVDLDEEPSVKGITVGLSRVVLVGLCVLLWRRAPLGLGPVLCGLATQIVPRCMYLFFKLVYIAARWVLRLLRRDTPSLPQSAPGAAPPKVAVDAEACCICLDGTGGCDYVTPCGHAFHSACLRRWAAASPRCPLCNRRLEYRPSATQRLRGAFVLSYAEWARLHRLCDNWWLDPLFE